MYLLLGVIFLVCGGIMLIKPRVFYEITESWKNNAEGEPSGLYLLSTRVGGGFFLAVGIAGIIVFFT